MLNDVQQHKIDIILFIKLDRWFRNVADCCEIQKIPDANNVQWITTGERYDTTTTNGRLNLNIKLSIAQDESDRTSERIKYVFENKRRRGEPTSGNLPLGYRIDDKRMVIDEEKAKIAAAIFHKFIVPSTACKNGLSKLTESAIPQPRSPICWITSDT